MSSRRRVRAPGSTDARLHREFVAETHEDFGTLGWRLKTQPGYDPLGGMAAAHDLLEHFPGSTDAVADEFQALGASLLLRGETGYDERGGDAPIRNLAADFPEIYRHVEYEGYSFPSPPRHRRPGGEASEMLESVGMRARRNLREEFEGQEAQTDLADFVRKAIGWMEVGYRRAGRRYARHENRSRLMEFFRKLEQGADRLLKDAEEGDELHVDVVLATYQGTLRLMRQYEYGEWEEYSAIAIRA